MEGNYPTSAKDCESLPVLLARATDLANRFINPPIPATSSGGYGAHSSSAWYREAQKGTDMPLKPDDVNSANKTGLIEQSTDGTRLDNKLQDAKQGRDTNLA